MILFIIPLANPFGDQKERRDFFVNTQYSVK